MLRSNLKRIVEGTDLGLGRAFDLCVMLLVVLSIASFTIETLPDVSEGLRRNLGRFETLAVVLFSIEYALRVFVADRKFKFIFSFYGLIDLIAILPYYLAAFSGRFVGIDLRAIRIDRLLRVFRLLKLVQYSSAIQRFGRAFVITRCQPVLSGACVIGGNGQDGFLGGSVYRVLA